MTSALIYLVLVLLVAAVVFLLASVVFGRGEELPPLPPGASPTRLPAEGVTPDDVRALRFQQVLRGYKMSEVDWALDRLGTELAGLRARVDELEQRLAHRDPDRDNDRDSDHEPARHEPAEPEHVKPEHVEHEHVEHEQVNHG